MAISVRERNNFSNDFLWGSDKGIDFKIFTSHASSSGKSLICGFSNNPTVSVTTVLSFSITLLPDPNFPPEQPSTRLVTPLARPAPGARTSFLHHLLCLARICRMAVFAMALTGMPSAFIPCSLRTALSNTGMMPPVPIFPSST